MIIDDPRWSQSITTLDTRLSPDLSVVGGSPISVPCAVPTLEWRRCWNQLCRRNPISSSTPIDQFTIQLSIGMFWAPWSTCEAFSQRETSREILMWSDSAVTRNCFCSEWFQKYGLRHRASKRQNAQSVGSLTKCGIRSLDPGVSYKKSQECSLDQHVSRNLCTDFRTAELTQQRCTEGIWRTTCNCNYHDTIKRNLVETNFRVSKCHNIGSFF